MFVPGNGKNKGQKLTNSQGKIKIFVLGNDTMNFSEKVAVMFGENQLVTILM